MLNNLRSAVSLKVSVGVRHATLPKAWGRGVLQFQSPMLLFISCLLGFSGLSLISLSLYVGSSFAAVTLLEWGVMYSGRPEDAIENAEESSHCSLWCDGLPSRGQTLGLEPSGCPVAFVCVQLSAPVHQPEWAHSGAFMRLGDPGCLDTIS